MLFVFDRELDLVWREVSVLWVPLVQTASSTLTGPVDCLVSLLWLTRLCFVLFLLSNRLACDLFCPPCLRWTWAAACGGVAVSLTIVVVLSMVDTENSVVVLFVP